MGVVALEPSMVRSVSAGVAQYRVHSAARKDRILCHAPFGGELGRVDAAVALSMAAASGLYVGCHLSVESAVVAQAIVFNVCVL